MKQVEMERGAAVGGEAFAVGPAYPVSKAKCAGCSACSLVTQTLTGMPIEPAYYQCLAGVQADCRGE